MLPRSTCRYCGHSIAYITVYGRRKAVETTPVPYGPRVRGYAYRRSQGWIAGRDGHPAPTEVLPRHACALIEEEFDLEDMRLGDGLDELVIGESPNIPWERTA